MSHSSSSSSSGGIGFAGLLAIVFITLKLTDVIDWSWWWVLCPLWGLAALIMGIMIMGGLAVGVIAGITAICKYKRQKPR